MSLERDINWAPGGVFIWEPLHYDFLSKPTKYWEEVYEQDMYYPILVLGNRKTPKYEVAIQICNHFDDDFAVDKNVFHDIEQLTKSLKQKRTCLVPHLHPYSNRNPQTGMNTLHNLLDSCRAGKTHLCFGGSYALDNLDKYLLDQISDVVVVQKTFPNYHVVEHLHFHLPVTPNDIARPPSFEDDDEFRTNYIEFRKKLKEHISVYISKYPRCDDYIMRKFKNYRKSRMDDVMSGLKEQMEVE